MRLSRYFLPTLKEAPSDAQIVSHQLMLRAGLIKQEAAGIYAWLPLGLRVLNRIEQIVREEMEGNLCRCTGYHNIVKAILAAADEMAPARVAAE